MEGLEIIFKAYGHYNIKATHKSTFEITKEEFVTPKGDCIIAIKSEYAVADLPVIFKNKLKSDNARVVIKLESEGVIDFVNAYGSSDLLLTSRDSMVIRKSSYIDDRTLAIKADKAAVDIKRNLISKLKNPKTELKITLKLIEF